MLSSSPTPAIQVTSDDPPKLMKGRGRPVKGMVEVITATFMNAWKMIQLVIPVASTRPKLSGASMAILKPR